MKLRNKKTGEIIDTLNNYDCTKGISFGADHHDGNPTIENYNSLAELNEEWEDYEEPKESFWTIGKEGTPIEYKFDFDGKFYEECDNKWVDKIKEIGFYFETKEEAELAVSKLKAWKRLKDKGFEFGPVDRYEALCGNGFNIPITATMPPEAYTDAEVSKDLDICFGVEK